MLKVFFVVVLFNGVSSLVCFKTLSVQQEVPETYQFSFYEAYDGEDCFLCSCTKSRLSVGVGTRLVKKLVNKTVSVCCEGYVEDVEYDGAGLKCIPVCNPPCQNGFCRNPNECACDPGYAVDPYGIKNKCTALCLEGCSVPECLPCDSGNTTDMCHGNCHNGICVAPGICHCDPGYTRQSGICEPICASCEHGTCIAPDVCECDFGYTEECNSCKPFCFGCEHGKCKSPGQCECNAGYKAINRVCEPYCEECDGKCVAPNTCVCEPGWYWRGGHCLPHCSVRCGNGTCVAPDVCSCYSGYQVQPHDGYETALCQPVCADCPHECIAPEVCARDALHGTESTTEDGRVCDCNHCGNLDRQSDKIPCTSTMEADGEVKEANGTDYSVTSGPVEIVPLVVHTVTLVQDKPIPEAKINTCSHLETARHHWIYGAIITVQFLIILITLAILLKKTISDRLKIRKFVPKDIPNSEVAVEYTKKIEDS